jgi:hypothetical protein
MRDTASESVTLISVDHGFVTLKSMNTSANYYSGLRAAQTTLTDEWRMDGPQPGETPRARQCRQQTAQHAAWSGRRTGPQ